MAKLLITTDENEVIEVQGRMTFKISKVQTDNGDILIASGQLSMHNYIEGIVGIESARYKLTNVEIVEEVFGTNDFNILYEFILADGCDFEVKKDTLSEEAIKEIEREEYRNDESNKWEV
jgi:glutamine cyclotransferase